MEIEIKEKKVIKVYCDTCGKPLTVEVYTCATETELSIHACKSCIIETRSNDIKWHKERISELEELIRRQASQ